MADFKVGDKIRLIQNVVPAKVGCRGVVVYIHNRYITCSFIEQDRSLCGFGHNQHTEKSKLGYVVPWDVKDSRWNIKAEQMELYDWSDDLLPTQYRPKGTKLEIAAKNKIEEIKKVGGTVVNELIEKNKTLAIQEGQRQIGKAASNSVFDTVLDIPVIKALPENLKNLLLTPIGKYVIANVIASLAVLYKGAQKKKVDFVVDSLLRGTMADVGDSLDITKHVDDLIHKFSDKIPGFGETTDAA